MCSGELGRVYPDRHADSQMEGRHTRKPDPLIWSSRSRVFASLSCLVAFLFLRDPGGGHLARLRALGACIDLAFAQKQ